MKIAVDLGYGFVKAMNTYGEKVKFPSLICSRPENGLGGILGSFSNEDYSVTYWKVDSMGNKSTKRCYIGDAAMAIGSSVRSWDEKQININVVSDSTPRVARVISINRNESEWCVAKKERCGIHHPEMVNVQSERCEIHHSEVVNIHREDVLLKNNKDIKNISTERYIKHKQKEKGGRVVKFTPPQQKTNRVVPSTQQYYTGAVPSASIQKNSRAVPSAQTEKNNRVVPSAHKENDIPEYYKLLTKNDCTTRDLIAIKSICSRYSAEIIKIAMDKSFENFVPTATNKKIKSFAYFIRGIEEYANKRAVNFEAIKETYNSVCKSLPPVIDITDDRRYEVAYLLSKISKRQLLSVFEKAEKSDFLAGRVHSSTWRAGFDWLVKYNHAIAVLEGAYDNLNNASAVKNNTIKNKFVNFEQPAWDFDRLQALEYEDLEKYLNEKGNG